MGDKGFFRISQPFPKDFQDRKKKLKELGAEKTWDDILEDGLNVNEKKVIRAARKMPEVAK